jgi:hypothetical protein
VNLFDELTSVVGALSDAKVEYALVGGLAVAVWGAPRATKDIDLLVQPESLDAAKRTVRALGYTLEAGPMQFRDGMEVHRVNKVREGKLMTLDFLLVNQNLQDAFASRHQRELQGFSLMVVSRDALIGMKLTAGRPQDQADVVKLQEQDR